MIIRRLVVICAVVAAMAVSVYLFVGWKNEIFSASIESCRPMAKLINMDGSSPDSSNLISEIIKPSISLCLPQTISEFYNENIIYKLKYGICRIDTYPFKWQNQQRENSKRYSENFNVIPADTNEISPAKFNDYAYHSHSKDIVLEGIRREPNNALYHYMLADLYLMEAVDYSLKKKNVRKQGASPYDYKILDRNKYELGMKEIMAGTKLPLITHREEPAVAMLKSLPPASNLFDEYNETGIKAAIIFPEYSMIRNLARKNGIYMNLLLSEGKVEEAKKYLKTVEYLVMQSVNYLPSSIVGVRATKDIGIESKKNDARMCRFYGLNNEAKSIENNQNLLIGKIEKFFINDNNNSITDNQVILQKHAGMLAYMSLNNLCFRSMDPIDKSILEPTRLAEYVVAEGIVASTLTLFSFMLLIYAILKYLRWKIANKKSDLPEMDIKLTRQECIKIIIYGLLAPLVLYLIFISIPTISGRDHGIITAGLPYAIGQAIFILWTLIVPTTLATNFLWKRGIENDFIIIENKRKAIWVRLLNNILTVIWVILAIPYLFFPIIMLLLLPFLYASSPATKDLELLVIIITLAAIMLLAVTFIPLIWERKRPSMINFRLSITKSMITVYAAMVLFFSILVPVCTGFEHYYIKSDILFKSNTESKDISQNIIEYKLVNQLRNTVREGALKLGLPWDRYVIK